jgi:hypothetical protein
MSTPIFSGVSDVVSTFSRYADKAAVEWIATMHEGLRLLKEIPQQTYLVRFEDMALHSRETMGQIAEFCELPFDEVFLTYAHSVLEPVPHRGPVELHPAIQPLFTETMAALEYMP